PAAGHGSPAIARRGRAPCTGSLTRLGACGMVARTRGARVGARPQVIRAISPTAAALALRAPRAGAARPLVSARPAPPDRKFRSEAVEAALVEPTRSIAAPELAWLFENCFPNTLDTTVHYTTVDGRPDTFVVTGDIDAMWLRDSSAQVWPYLPLAKDDQA